MNIVDIKNFRNRNRLTQSDLAKLVGVGIETVKKWEQGKNPISKSAILIIQQYDFKQYKVVTSFEEPAKPSYQVPSQMDLMLENIKLLEEISELKSRIIELQDELLEKNEPARCKRCLAIRTHSDNIN